MALAAIFFLASLSGLALLFALKSIEAKRARVFAPSFRAGADNMALSLRSYMHTLRLELERVPPALVYLGRFLLHELALGAAKIARMAETQLHSAADMVSHKRGFEKRPDRTGEPRSEYLKQIEGEKRDANAPAEPSDRSEQS